MKIYIRKKKNNINLSFHPIDKTIIRTPKQIEQDQYFANLRKEYDEINNKVEENQNLKNQIIELEEKLNKEKKPDKDNNLFSSNEMQKEIVVDLAKEYIQEENKKIEYKEETKLENIRIKLYQKNSFDSPKENKEMVVECINGYEPKALRKMKGEELYNLIIFSALYTDENGLQDIRNKLNLKMRLFKVNKQEVMRNLTFYEGKEFDTKKLFKFFKNK